MATHGHALEARDSNIRFLTTNRLVINKGGSPVRRRTWNVETKPRSQGPTPELIEPIPEIDTSSARRQVGGKSAPTSIGDSRVTEVKTFESPDRAQPGMQGALVQSVRLTGINHKSLRPVLFFTKEFRFGPESPV